MTKKIISEINQNKINKAFSKVLKDKEIDISKMISLNPEKIKNDPLYATSDMISKVLIDYGLVDDPIEKLGLIAEISESVSFIGDKYFPSATEKAFFNRGVDILTKLIMSKMVKKDG